MPSDSRLTQTLAALAQPISEFRAFVQGALRQAETFRAEQKAGADERAARARAELGSFAEGHLDPARFAALFPSAPPAPPTAMAALERAIVALQAIADGGDQVFVVNVPAGGRLGRVAEAALAETGRAFGAAVLADIVRGGRYHAREHDRLLHHQEFRTWNRAVRRHAPPLVMTLHGSDLHAGALTDYADGREKIVLVVTGPCAPAPLVRCITPGTLVLQTVDGSGLDRVAGCEGPALAALMPPGSASFLHEPVAGSEPWQRLTVQSLGEAPKRGVGGMSVWQMSEDQKLLADLARTPFAIPTGAGPASPAIGADDAVNRIASWLLSQSGLPQP